MLTTVIKTLILIDIMSLWALKFWDSWLSEFFDISYFCNRLDLAVYPQMKNLIEASLLLSFFPSHWFLISAVVFLYTIFLCCILYPDSVG